MGASPKMLALTVWINKHQAVGLSVKRGIFNCTAPPAVFIVSVFQFLENRG